MAGLIPDKITKEELEVEFKDYVNSIKADEYYKESLLYDFKYNIKDEHVELLKKYLDYLKNNNMYNEITLELIIRDITHNKIHNDPIYTIDELYQKLCEMNKINFEYKKDGKFFTIYFPSDKIDIDSIKLPYSFDIYKGNIRGAICPLLMYLKPLVKEESEDFEPVKPKVDKKEIKTIKDLFDEMNRLNPGVDLFLKNETGLMVMYSSVDGKDLKLPDGFDYSDKYGITSKDKAKGYIGMLVRPLAKKEEEKKEEEKKEHKTVEEIFKLLQELNPDADLELKQDDGKYILYSKVNIDSLSRPKEVGASSTDKNYLIFATNTGLDVVKFVVKEKIKVDEKKEEEKKEEEKKKPFTMEQKRKKIAEEIFKKLQALNPDADLELKQDGNKFTLHSKKSRNDLKLPNEVELSTSDKNTLRFVSNLATVMVNVVVKEEKKEAEKEAEPKKPRLIQSKAELFNELKNINEGLRLERKEDYSIFYSSIEASKLKLPDGFVYDEKEGIVSTFNTSTGTPLKVSVLPLEKYLAPKVEPKVEIKKTSRDIYKEIVALNPKVQFEFTYEKGFGVLLSTVEATKLKLPDGFVYDEENGINNKSTSSDSDFIHISVKELIIVEEKIDTKLNDFEDMFLKDAESEGLDLYDQEFYQMMNERVGINKTRVIKYLVDKRKQELRANLNEFELHFVDDAQAENIKPGDPEFEQMFNQRTGIDRNKVTDYLNDKIFTVVIPEPEKKKEPPKVEEPEEENEEELDDEPVATRNNSNRLSFKEARDEKLKQLRKEKGLLAMLKYMKQEKKREKLIAKHDMSNFDMDITNERKMMGEGFRSYTHRGFTDIFIISIVTIIISILLVLIIRLI